MSVVRVWPLMLAGWLLSSMAFASADTRLPDSSVGDWSAVLSKISLVDESVLFEYTARTFSGSTEGAMLAISFVPRFNCEQTVSVRLPAEFQSELAADVTLQMSFGSEEQSFAGLVDDAGDFLFFSVGATADKISALREIMDVSPRVSVRIVPEAGDTPERDGASDSVEFSLIGSRLTTLSAESHCQNHVPLAYDLR